MYKKQFKAFKIVHFIPYSGIIKNLKWIFDIKGIGIIGGFENEQQVVEFKLNPINLDNFGYVKKK